MMMIFPIALIDTGVIFDKVEETAQKVGKVLRDISESNVIQLGRQPESMNDNNCDGANPRRGPTC